VKIGFGGGCHWCTEAVFDVLKGVEQVEQGWIAVKEEGTFSEGVIVHFDPEVIGLDLLIEIHLQTHNATSMHSMRQKYRSAIYTFDEVQYETAKKILKAKQSLFLDPLVTRVYTFAYFKLNEERYLSYYKKFADRPFCINYIEPKRQFLKSRYAQWLKR